MKVFLIIVIVLHSITLTLMAIMNDDNIPLWTATYIIILVMIVLKMYDIDSRKHKKNK